VAAVQLIRPVTCHQHDLTRPQRAAQEDEHVAGGPVGPVQILQHQHYRGALGAAHQQRTHGVEDLQLILTVALDARRAGLCRTWQQPADAGCGGGHLGQQLHFGRVVGELAQGIHHRQIG